MVPTVMYKRTAYLEITCGGYEARCKCCKTFRNTPNGVRPRARYDNEVRDLVLDRILKGSMNVEQARESLRREFLLELSTGFVYEVLCDRAEKLDIAEHRRKVLKQFSGTLSLTWKFLARLPVVENKCRLSLRERTSLRGAKGGFPGSYSRPTPWSGHRETLDSQD